MAEAAGGAGGPKEGSAAARGFACSADGCDKYGTMVCPTCKKLGAGDVYFHDQECFKKFWPKHKGFHKLFKQMQAAKGSSNGAVRVADGFEGFEFTGPLRPAEVTPRMGVPAGIVKPDYADDGTPVSEQAVEHRRTIDVNTPEQIAIMREVGRIGREVLELAAAAIKPGVTGDDIDRIVYDATIERGAYPSPLNYCGFPKSVCTSVNEVICHGIPDKRPLEEGDIVNLDVTVYKHGHHADLNETFFVGKVDAESHKLVKTAFECLQAAVALVKPGTLYRDVGNAISKRAKVGGCSIVKSYCGHGVHRLFHTSPNIPHYAKNKAVGAMKAGHIFTIEPMVNAGSHYDTTWPDGWTAVTQDGKRSAQFEHTILVTEDGYELLTARTGTTTMVWDESYTQRGVAEESAAADTAATPAPAAAEPPAAPPAPTADA
mmetsp:Transcript_5620/g.20118  ORF Transcript_5620/g.20118 Transcript_5620/m.20118 type:complete len:431 (-) Transcript_5620:61-1353(-)